MITRLGVLLLCLVAPLLVSAQSDTSDFTIKVFGSTDAIAPTVPVIQSVTPISPSQIDVTWSSSTDNFAVFGYVVFRDSVAIATTTALFYNDTSLIASTSYSYNIVAFDGVPNYSASSTAVATTTPDIVVPPVVNQSESGGTRTRVVLDSLSVAAGVATATIDIDTTNHSRIEVRYGLTSSYELAYIVGNEFKKNHLVNVFDLAPNTQYYYEVIGYTPSGAQTVLRQASFMTLDDAPPQPPTNVSELSAIQQGDAVRLTYSLPPDFPSGGTVRVVRSHFGYPQFLSDGIVVYEGTAESVLDASAFFSETQAWYTVFAIDPNGLVSSGAVVRVVDNRTFQSLPVSSPDTVQTPTNSVDSAIGGATSNETNPFATAPTSTPEAVVTEIGFPELQQFTITQDQVVWSFSSSSIVLSSDVPFTVSVDSDLVTGDFKTIVATLYDPRQSGKQFSFLLRLNGDRSVYAATIAPFRIAGVSDVVVEVFDHDSRVVGTYRTNVTFTESTFATTTPLTTWYWRVQTWLWWLLLVAPVMVLGTLWLVLAKRDRKAD